MIWTSLALALPPSGRPGSVPVGAGGLERMTISTDGSVLAGRDRSNGTGWALSIDGWKASTASPCASVTGVALVPYQQTQEVYFACDDGRVHLWELVDEALEVVNGSDGAPVVWQLGASGSALRGIWWDGDSTAPYLYALADDGTQAQVHVLAPRTGLIDADVWSAYGSPQLAVSTGLRTAAVDLGTLFLAHPGGRVTMVSLSSGAISYSPLSPGTLLYSVDDIAPGGGKLFTLDTSGGVLYEFRPLAGTTQAPFLGFDAPTAVAANLTSGDQWLLVGGPTATVFELQNGVLLDRDNPVWSSSGALLNLQDAVATPGYGFGGGLDGQVHVFTAKPWVDALTLSETSGTLGDTLRLGFRIDAPASWQVQIGGTRAGGGQVVATGSTSSTGATVEVDLEVDEAWAEGMNRIYVRATNGLQETGHGRIEFEVDTIPRPPTLTDGALGFADGALILSFEGIPDADLERYEVWISDAPWTSDDYEIGDGGPPPPAGGPDTPLVVPAVGGQRVSVRLEPLQNDTTYYVGVRSYDAGGAESAMSQVIQGTPRRAFRASDLAGETGGCDSSGGLGGALLALVAGLATRRRALPAALALLAAPLAYGADDPLAPDNSGPASGDFTKQRANLELRYGGFTKLEDESIKSVYGSSGHNMLQFEIGPQIARFFEIDLQFGFYQELARTVAADGSASTIGTMLTWWPMGLSGTARLQLIDEQLFVPHARLGADYVLWSELTDNATGGKDRVSGTKMGHHYALGGSLLLDLFAPARASLLEAQTGINDTYLVVEWRRQNIDARKTPWGAPVKEGFDLSGGLLTIGIKLDY